MSAVEQYAAVMGVEWCVTHQGISDECGEDRNGHCDMADTCQDCLGDGIIDVDDDAYETCPACMGTGREECDIRPLFVHGDRS